MPRTEQYRRPDGSLTSDRSARILVSRGDVAGAVAGSVVPESYFQGSAKHESNYAINELDTEVSGFKSYGVWQISDEEAGPHGGLGDWWTLEACARVFVPVAEQRARNLLSWAKLSVSLADAPRDLWAFLALYHNEGGGPARSAIEKYGINWSGAGGYAANNKGRSIVAYGNDCIPSGLSSLSQVVDDVDESIDAGGGGGVLGGVLVAALFGAGLWLMWRGRR